MLKIAMKPLSVFIHLRNVPTDHFNWFRCKFYTKLLLSIENYVIDQPNAADIRRDDDQSLFVSNLLNRLQ